MSGHATILGVNVPDAPCEWEEAKDEKKDGAFLTRPLRARASCSRFCVRVASREMALALPSQKLCVASKVGRYDIES